MMSKPTLLVRECTSCLRELTLDNFYKKSEWGKTRYRAICKKCHAAKARDNINKIASRNREVPPTISYSKHCSACKMLKPIADFHRNINSITGLDWVCKRCKSISGRKHYHKTRDTHPIEFATQRMLAAAKIRASKDGLPFNLTIEYLRSLVVNHCPVLGIPLVYVGNRINQNSATLDKFFPELGYVIGNVYIISSLVNQIKSNATSEQVHKVYIWMNEIEAQSQSKNAAD